MSRSFTGCKRCKARRQKCDEQRPACTRCTTASVPCRYALQLQWGGRAFPRSRFGACIGDGGMQRLEYSPGEFIYTTESAVADKANGGPSQTLLPHPATAVDPFSNLSTDQKSLLHHFLRDASQITACHPSMRHEICQMLVPRALHTPSLLYATLALSAIHLQALRHSSDNVKSAPHIARLVALSLEHFRMELQQRTPQDKGSSDVLLATARTLCLAEIHSGAIHPHSWRAHIEGARALMVAMGVGSGEGQGEGEGEFRRYLDRWHRSIVSLTALTGNGPPIGETDDLGALAELPETPDYLDDYWGFSIRLAAVFRGIGAVAWRARQRRSPSTSKGATGGGVNRGADEGAKQGADYDADADADTQILHHEINTLQSTLTQLMAQNTSPPTFYPGVAPRLTPTCKHQLTLCNEAFQHSALIQIHRRLLHHTPSSSSSSSSPTVQASVQRILACAAEIGPAPGLSPWVLLTTPLFIAGCEARGGDRERVRTLLRQLYETIRVPNVVQAGRFLELYWGGKIGGDGNGRDEGWNEYLDRMNIDFIPY